MKLRIYPKKADLMVLLESKLDDKQEDLDDAQNKVDTAKNRVFVIQGEQEHAERLVELADAEVAELREKILLLGSHEPPEVMLEIDL